MYSKNTYSVVFFNVFPNTFHKTLRLVFKKSILISLIFQTSLAENSNSHTQFVSQVYLKDYFTDKFIFCTVGFRKSVIKLLIYETGDFSFGL